MGGIRTRKRNNIFLYNQYQCYFMKRVRIVIVENDEDERMFMAEAFENSDMFDILTICRNGNQLEEWLVANLLNLPDVVLSDLNMPGKDGYDVIKFMKSRIELAHISIFITSTSSTSSLIDKCISLGANYYIVKPETFTDYMPFVLKLHRQATAIDSSAAGVPGSE